MAAVEGTTKRVERRTEQIGTERLAERNEAVAAFHAFPLTEKHPSPPGVASPKVAVVRGDGGWWQIRERGADAQTPDAAADLPAGRERGQHGREEKAAPLWTVDRAVSANDPCPAIPPTFGDPTRILKVARDRPAVSAGQDGVTEAEPRTRDAAAASAEQAR